jgi:sugar lactone lactonase YvrE
VVCELEVGRPDGIAIDDEGCLWVAMWGGGRVEGVDPLSQRVVATVTLPCTNVSSVAFGCTHRDELYITTARADLPLATLAREPHAGEVFVTRPGTTGPLAHRFALP